MSRNASYEELYFVTLTEVDLDRRDWIAGTKNQHAW